MRFYNSKENVISATLTNIIPFFMDASIKKKKIVVTNYVLNKSYYIEIGTLFAASLLKFNYGVGKAVSSLYIYNIGMQLRTIYYVMPFFFDLICVETYFKCINNSLYSLCIGYIKKKFNSHAY